jgi:hypothetical protein
MFRCILAAKTGCIALSHWAESAVNQFSERSIVEGSSMAQARTPVRVMYACGLVVAGSVLFLMIYSGMLEGVGEAIFDLVKEIVKSFIG